MSWLKVLRDNCSTLESSPTTRGSLGEEKQPLPPESATMFESAHVLSRTPQMDSSSLLVQIPTAKGSNMDPVPKELWWWVSTHPEIPLRTGTRVCLSSANLEHSQGSDGFLSGLLSKSI